jgi:16S rRNA (cytosine1402-N4)-methyltransferase
MNFKHESVLLDECIAELKIKPNGTYIDGTLGGGGHSLQICKRLNKEGTLIGIDQDKNAISKAQEVLKDQLNKVIIIHNNFFNVQDVLQQINIEKIDGALLDLGVSSHQLDEGERGFSYNYDARLDMRMDTLSGFSAHNVINQYTEEELTKILHEYGEERWAKRIAKFIVEERQQKEINTTFELVTIIKKAVPKGARLDGPHPAKRTFQAIRIEVNGEIKILESTIINIVEKLNVGGRLCVISFHSLEDRIIKNTFRNLQNPCVCPRDFPICMCKKEKLVNVVTRKPILPTLEEVEINRRARSAKLRVIERV